MEKKKTHRIGYSVRISITISFFSTFSITAAPTSTSSSSRIYANPITWSAKLSNQFWSHSEMSCRTFFAVINGSVAQGKTEKSPPLSIVPHIKTPPENNIQQNYSPKIIYTKTKIKLATVNIIKPKPHIQTQTQYTNETKRIKGRWNEKWRKYLVKAFLSFMAIKKWRMRMELPQLLNILDDIPMSNSRPFQSHPWQAYAVCLCTARFLRLQSSCRSMVSAFSFIFLIIISFVLIKIFWKFVICIGLNVLWSPVHFMNFKLSTEMCV